MSPLVITIIGADRPGLVESVAAVIEDHGGLWVESRMARLGGHFAGILRASVPNGEVEPTSSALQALGAGGLRVVVEVGEEDQNDLEGHLMMLELVGADRPGIIRKVSEALAAREVNVEELETRCDGAPWSGDALFRATARLRAPVGLDVEKLRESLEAIANDLMVDITLGWPDSV